MATTYSPNLKLSLMANGENSGTWGTISNNNWDLVDSAIAGAVSISMTGSNYVLTYANGDPTSQAFAAIVIVGGTGGYKVIAPTGLTKSYIVYNTTVANITFGTASGVYVTISPGSATTVFTSDGTNYYSALTGVAGNFGIGGNALIGGTLGVTGATTLSSTLAVYGNTAFGGYVTLAGNPVSALQAATKQYVDAINISSTTYPGIAVGGSSSLGFSLTLGYATTSTIGGVLIDNNTIKVNAYNQIYVAGGGGGGGVPSISTAAPLQVNGSLGPITTAAIISMPQATSSVSGYLAYNDFQTFSNKISLNGALGTPASGNLSACTGLPIGGVTGLGSGVSSALGNVPNAAGGFVTYSGALGTPSSGTLTNCTGYQAANISGTVANASVAASCSGNAATATNPQGGGTFVTTVNIGGQSVNYANSAGSCTGNAATSSSCSGNAATATSAGYTTSNVISNYGGVNYLIIDGAGQVNTNSQPFVCGSTCTIYGSSYLTFGTMGAFSSTSATMYYDGSNYFYVKSGTLSGGVRLAANATSWSSASDETIKDIIEPISDAEAKVNTLRSVIGKFKTDPEDTRRPFLIAQDVLAVFPEAVDVDPEGEDPMSLRYSEMVPLLVAAIKELSAKVAALEAK